MTVTARRAAISTAWALLVALAADRTPVAGTESAPPTIAALNALTGDSIPLTGNVVIVDFWASWCVPCRQSFPWMSTILARYRERGLRIVTVDLDKSPAAGRKFMKELKATFPVVYDSTGTLAKRYQLEVMPTSFIYGRDGTLREREEGFHPDHAEAVEHAIQDLLDEKGSK